MNKFNGFTGSQVEGLPQCRRHDCFLVYDQIIGKYYCEHCWKRLKEVD